MPISRSAPPPQIVHPLRGPSLDLRLHRAFASLASKRTLTCVELGAYVAVALGALACEPRDASERPPNSGQAARMDATDSGAGDVDAAGHRGSEHVDAGRQVPEHAETAFCTDDFEDNDRLDQAAPLVLDDGGSTSITGTYHDMDPDHFVLEAERADPVRLSLEFERGAETVVGVTVSDDRGELLDLEDTVTAGAWTDVWAAIAGAATTISLEDRDTWPLSDCLPYSMSVDSAFCTDDFEDNDTPERAKPLGVGRGDTEDARVDATFHDLDPDHYLLTSSGTCATTAKLTFRRTVPTIVRMQVRTRLGDPLSSAEGDAAADATLRVSWDASAGSDYVLSIEDADSWGHADCVSYELTVDGC